VARLFFALWPDLPVRDEVEQFARQLPLVSGRLVPTSNTHITLAFLGNVDEQTTAGLIKKANHIEMNSFSLTLDQLGWWKKPKIAWLAPTRYPQVLPELAAELRKIARNSGVSLDERPYRPHLTLARKIKSPLLGAPARSIFWNINEFCLVESKSEEMGVKYEVKQSWPLKFMR
jgi:RNA 2',3'-cyclic 3'-phosphodiesterase